MIRIAVLIAIWSISTLACSGARKSVRAAGGIETQAKSQMVEVKKMTTWLTGNSRVLYENSKYAILGLEHKSLSKPADSVLLDVFGLENRQMESTIEPRFFAFKISASDVGGKKIKISKLSLMRGGKEKIHMEHTACDLVYVDSSAKCEIAIKITDEIIAPGGIEVYAMIAKVEGFDTPDDTIGIKMTRYYLENGKKQPEKVYALYLPNE